MVTRFVYLESSMHPENHNANVAKQFDPRANAYLTSATHAQGKDLVRLAQLVGERTRGAVLDVGSGGGHASFCVAPLADRVVACDLSETMLATVAQEALRRGLNNLETYRGAAEDLPFPEASFETVVTRYSAHHWRNLPGGLAQMRRVVKPDGMAVFMDVVSPGVPLLDTWLQSLELLRDSSHVRNASVAEWRTLLASAGFTPGEVVRYRLRLEFASWIARMQTPPSHVAAIRSLQQRAASEVADYFGIEADGSFTIDSALIVATPVANRFG
jgi:ubiquinone/menaquinone biosynthesis C-methylase UbiE